MATTDSDVRDGLSSVTRGTLFLLVATLLYVAFNFAARWIVIRSISFSDWNAFSLALALVSVVAAVGTLGLPSAVARSLPYVGSDAERRTIVRGSLTIGGVAAVASAVTLWLLGPWIAGTLHSSLLGPALTVFPIAVGTSIAVSLIAAIFQGYEDVTPNALYVQIVTPGLFVAFLIAVFVLPPRGIYYESALLAYVGANVASLLLTIAYALRRLPRLLSPGVGSPGALGHLLWFAAPLFLVTLTGTLTGTGDTLVLGIFHPTEVGTYTASLTLARLLQVGVGAAAYIFLPVAARFLRLKDLRSIQVTYVTITKWMILFSLPLFLLFLILPSRSLDFVYGPTYAVILLPLQLTVFGAFLTTAFGPAANAQVAFGQTRLLAYNSVIAAALDIGLAFALVPSEGLTGAAIAWAVANAVYTALSLLELAVLTRVHPFRPHFFLPLLVTALPIAAVLALAPVSFPLWSLPVLGVAIAGIFVLVVLVTHSVDEGDRLLLGAVEGLIGRPLPFVRRLGRLGTPRAKP
ncbi:MAG: oligosaccharide flippase family protein [Thermoplasmata archaeon]